MTLKRDSLGTQERTEEHKSGRLGEYRVIIKLQITLPWGPKGNYLLLY